MSNPVDLIELLMSVIYNHMLLTNTKDRRLTGPLYFRFLQVNPLSSEELSPRPELHRTALSIAGIMPDFSGSVIRRSVIL